MPNPYKTTPKQKGLVQGAPNASTGQDNATTKTQNSTNRICAIDFDGTLAKEVKPYDPKVAGPPIPRSIKLVQKWMKDNERIVIFTSRVSPSTHNNIQIRYARKLISAWCKQYLGRSFPITSDKSPMLEIWDNKAHRVETDTGRILASKVKVGSYPFPLNNEQKRIVEELTNKVYFKLTGKS